LAQRPGSSASVRRRLGPGKVERCSAALGSASVGPWAMHVGTIARGVDRYSGQRAAVICAEGLEKIRRRAQNALSRRRLYQTGPLKSAAALHQQSSRHRVPTSDSASRRRGCSGSRCRWHRNCCAACCWVGLDVAATGPGPNSIRRPTSLAYNIPQALTAGGPGRSCRRIGDGIPSSSISRAKLKCLTNSRPNRASGPLSLKWSVGCR
jgi:hypothetical protein